MPECDIQDGKCNRLFGHGVAGGHHHGGGCTVRYKNQTGLVSRGASTLLNNAAPSVFTEKPAQPSDDLAMGWRGRIPQRAVALAIKDLLLTESALVQIYDRPVTHLVCI